MSDPSPATEEELLDAFRGDLRYFAEQNLIIRTKAAVTSPLRFNRAQEIVHAKLSAQLRETGRIRAIILKARQEGISTYTAGRFYRRVSLYENQSALVIADQRKRGQTLFEIYEMFDRKLPDYLRPAKSHARRGWNLVYDDAQGHGLNSKLTVETAKDAAAGRGSTIQAVHASELAFWENPEQVWTSLMQAVPDVGSEVIIESTANGVGNMFHQMWGDAEAGDSSFLPIFLPWWVHEEYVKLVSATEREDVLDSLSDLETEMMTEGFEYEGSTHVLSVEQIAWRRATIRDKLKNDENLFRQEYPSTAREAFLVSGNCFFDEEALLEYENKATKPRRFTIAWDPERKMVRRKEAPRGKLRVWQEPFHLDPHAENPEREDGEYVIFADTATGKMSGERETIYAADREQGGRDFSAAYVLDVPTLTFVAMFHDRIAPERFADVLYAMGFEYGHTNPRTGNLVPALLGVERNHSSGETVVRRLKDDLGYPNLFYDRQINHRRNRMTPAAGFVTTEAKRTVLLDEFSAEIRQRTLTILDADLIRECFTFIRGEDGRSEAQEGCHDDRVIAAGGCVQMARHHRRPALPSGRRMVRRGGSIGRMEWEDAPTS